MRTASRNNRNLFIAWPTPLRPLARALALPGPERRALIKALPVVAFVRVALWLVTLRRLHRTLIRCDARRGSLDQEAAVRLGRAVSRVAAVVPGATCLTRALSLQLLLRRAGERSCLHVGFARRDGREVKGHAWLEWRGEVLIGGGETSAFASLLRLEG